MAALILWGHALAALAFGLLALGALRRPRDGGARLGLTVACILTALWALAVAGIGVGDVAARLGESLRNLVWLAVLATLVRQGRSGSVALYAVYAVAAGITAAAGLLAIIATLPLAREALAALEAMRLIAGMLAAVAGMMLAHQVAVGDAARRPEPAVQIAVALGGIWGVDLLVALLG